MSATIKRRLTSIQRKGGDRVAAKLRGKCVRIWSGEHRAYWRPNRSGYVTRADDAGIYFFDEALAATSGCGPEKRIVFEVVETLSKRVDTNRDWRQYDIATWAKESFGAEQATSLPQRGIRLLEEAIELYQACGGEPAMAHRLIDYVFARPVGEIRQEIGGVSVCLLVMGEAAGLSVDEAERAEIARVKSKPRSHFTARNAAKNAAGFDTTKKDGAGPRPARRRLAAVMDRLARFFGRCDKCGRWKRSMFSNLCFNRDCVDHPGRWLQ